METVPLRGLAAFVLILLGVTGCSTGIGASAQPTPIPTETPFPTPTVDDQVQAVARTGPAWLDQCPTHTGRITTGFAITTVPGNVVAPGFCDTFVQRGPHGDLITFRATWNAGKKLGKGRFVITYLMPRNGDPTVTATPKIVSQQGEPP